MFSEITCKRDFNAKSLSFNVVDDYVVLSKVTMAEISKLLKDNNMEKNGNLKKTPFSSHTVSSHTATSLHILSKEQLIAIILGKEK